jgi:hypothetical protein
MSEQFERLSRPSPILESPGVLPARGISRTNITVIISAVALFAAAAGAGVSYWRFYAAEKQKTLNEANQLLPDARANAIIEEYDKNPNSHPRLQAELKKLHEDLTYSAPFGALGQYEELAFSAIALRVAAPALERRKLASEKNEADAAARNHNQDSAKKGQETRVATKQGDLVDGVLTQEMINSLSRSARGGASGDSNLLGIPPSRGAGSLPIGTRPVDPLKNNSNFGKDDDPLRNTSNIGKSDTDLSNQHSAWGKKESTAK